VISTSLALGRAAALDPPAVALGDPAVVVLRDRGVALLAPAAGPGDPQPASATTASTAAVSVAALSMTSLSVTAAGSAPMVRSLIGLTCLFLCC
jgi:hypothetical protein